MSRPKADFLHMRVDPGRKGQIQVAASLVGVSMSSFVRDAAAERARAVILRELQPTTQTRPSTEPAPPPPAP